MTPSLDSITLVEWLTELRETFYLLKHQDIIKGQNSGIARWKSCIGWGTKKGHRASLPSPSALLLSPNLHVFTNPEALQTQSFWGFKEASLHKQETIN